MNNTDRLCLGCMNDNGGAEVCPICGYKKGAAEGSQTIDAGTWIVERYLVGRVIDTNGEGNIYIGWDNQNDNVVYIKEYFPQGLCERLPNKSVKITLGKEYEFNNGIMQFIDISKKIAAMEPSALMPVVETLELGGTAYSIIKAAAGIPLREFLLRNGGALKWEQAKPLFMPLLTTLEQLHAEGIYHGGISPETVIVGRDGRLHLMGVSVLALRDAASEFNSQIFPGFAALEQYEAEREIGTYTDVYGVAATLFRVLIGNPPMAANERAVHDNMSIPAKAAETIPPYVLTALANALQIESENRTATISELKNDFLKTATAAPAAVAAATQGDSKKSVSGTNKNRKYALMAAGITTGALLILALILVLLVFGGNGDKDTSSTMSVSIPSTSSYGDIDSTYSTPVIENLFDVPKFEGENYADIIANGELTRTFKFIIKGTEFSEKVPVGHIISQSIAEGEKVKKETEIEFVISLGSANVKIPELSGRSEIEARIALLELGITPNNIVFVERYDENAAPQAVISTSPEAGETIMKFDKVEVYINIFERVSEDQDNFEDIISNQ